MKHLCNIKGNVQWIVYDSAMHLKSYNFYAFKLKRTKEKQNDMKQNINPGLKQIQMWVFVSTKILNQLLHIFQLSDGLNNMTCMKLTPNELKLVIVLFTDTKKKKRKRKSKPK